VQPTANDAHELGEASLDRHVDIFVGCKESETLLLELSFNQIQSLKQSIAIRCAQNSPRSEHAGVRARAGDILRPQTLIYTDRCVQALEIGVLGLVEARHEGVSLGPSPAGPELAA
jgi:hypothetical protein